jgi:hypothetical protein
MVRFEGCGFALLLVLVAFGVAGCRRESSHAEDSPAPSSSVLDGMQLDSARRIANESAVAAMKERNLGRLKQLNVWVRGRAQVDILRPEEQSALDLAITCLERPSPPGDADEILTGLKPNVLQGPARDVCASPKERR